MAKIANLPGLEVINGFKGVIDFYVHDGQPCARKWPASPGHHRAPAVQATWPAFAWAASNWNSLSPAVQEAYRQMAVSTNMTARDIFTKSFINGTALILKEV